MAGVLVKLSGLAFLVRYCPRKIPESCAPLGTDDGKKGKLLLGIALAVQLFDKPIKPPLPCWGARIARR